MKNNIKKLFDRKDKRAFMGPTHALSGLAVFLLVVWLNYDFVKYVTKSNHWLVHFSSGVILVGFALFPDYDSVKSTIIKVTAPLGVVISKILRSTSTGVQAAVRGKSDQLKTDPHRGFWHTILGAVIIGLTVNLLTRLSIEIHIGEKVFTLGFLFAILFLHICMQLFMATILSEVFKRAKGKTFLHSVIINISTIVFSTILLISLPSEVTYNWMGVSATFGCIIHILGDMCTPQGVPVFFPLEYKGKRWWQYRFPFKIRAGSATENAIVIPFFLIICIVAAINIITRIMK